MSFDTSELPLSPTDADTARRRAEIDADLAEMGRDADYQREAAQIMAEFAVADAEAARLIDTEHGPYPYDDDELAELAALAKGMP